MPAGIVIYDMYTRFLGPRIRAALIHDFNDFCFVGGGEVECGWVLGWVVWGKTQNQVCEIKYK